LKELRDTKWITNEEAVRLDKLCREWKKTITGNTMGKK
jgi:hypothetical protein